MSNHSQEDVEAIERYKRIKHESRKAKNGHSQEDELKQLAYTYPDPAAKVPLQLFSIDELQTYLDKKVLEARIESLQWALNDYNMPDTDTSENLADFIDELKAKQTAFYTMYQIQKKFNQQSKEEE